MRNSILASLCRVLTLTLASAVFTGIAAEKESNDSLTAQQILRQDGDHLRDLQIVS